MIAKGRDDNCPVLLLPAQPNGCLSEPFCQTVRHTLSDLKVECRFAIWLSLEGYSCRSASFREPVQAVSRPLSALISRRRTNARPGLFRIFGGKVRRCVLVFQGQGCLRHLIASLTLPD